MKFVLFFFLVLTKSCNVYKTYNKNMVFDKSKSIISIPFEIYRNDIRFKAKIKDKTCYVLLDNGSLWNELLFFGSPKIDSLNLNISGQTIMGDSTVSNSILMDIDSNVSVDFGSIQINNQVAIISRYIKGRPNPWEGADLQISAAFFNNFVVEIDFEKSELSLHNIKNYIYSGMGEIFKMKEGPHNSRLITLSALLYNKKKITLDFLIDIGGIYPLYLPLGNNDKITLSPKAERKTLANGFTGPVYGYLDKISELKLGKFKLKNIQTAFTEVVQGQNEFGKTMIGINLLRYFKVIFNYHKNIVILEARQKYLSNKVIQLIEE